MDSLTTNVMHRDQGMDCLFVCLRVCGLHLAHCIFHGNVFTGIVLV